MWPARLFGQGNVSKGYSGSESYVAIDKLINDGADELRIISPYIGVHYARMLLNVSKRKKVFVITSKETEGINNKAIKLLAAGQRHYVSLIAYFAILLAISVLLQFYLISAFVVAVLLIAVYLQFFYKKAPKNIKLKIADGKFIHEKAYISEKSAIVGSANLTMRGTHSNIEHIETIGDEAKIKELRGHFDELWHKS